MAVTSRDNVIEVTKQVINEVVAPLAKEIDQKRRFPKEAFETFASNGLLGLLVPEEFGGLGGTLQDLAEVTELLATSCGSTAMCFQMHSVGTAVIASRANDVHKENYLKQIAQGKKIGTLAFSESGTGSHFYIPEIKANLKDDCYVLNGKKSFVTNGEHADFLIVLTNSVLEKKLDMIIVDTNLPGVDFKGTWEGIGFSGNNSIALEMNDVMVPETNVIGSGGEGMDLIFEVIAPTFIIGVAGANVGLARGAYNAALEHAKNRRYTDGRSLAEIQAIQFYLSDMYGAVESASLFNKSAAQAAVEGKEGAVLNVMQSKIVACDTAQKVTNIAMQVCGGYGYTKNLSVERFLRDARAGSVMGPTTEVLKEWVGKSVAGIPLF
ncbi:acyl-CoA dehydrogenase family protein [Anaerobacillus sp. MEB173]|uniref:acyl-CoA dehydrogenase family protein n=1 Tax=Anaerobacillus sp. MEB173 TaxID=3383345 RepID=UPI003F938937